MSSRFAPERSRSRNAPAGPSPFRLAAPALPREKFSDRAWTAKGEPRATIALTALETLWFNTGTLCNLACATCYIESSPVNDALVHISAADVAAYLDEIAASGLPTREIGFTGGEPFMNPQFLTMLTDSLERGHDVLVLSNAMKPMRRHEAQLQALRTRFDGRLTIRVSLDHYSQPVHEAERGPRSWGPALSGLRWLSDEGFAIAVAGRILPGESEAEARAGYNALFAAEGIALDAADPANLVLFPEMDESADIAEITTACWDILGKDPAAIMCATSRMVVHRKGEPAPRVTACTLIPRHADFDMGGRLEEASREVALNHPHCARFCVLGGASCSA